MQWLDDFLSAPNIFSVESIENGKHKSHLQISLLKLLAQSRDGQYPVVVPMLTQRSGSDEQFSLFVFGKTDKSIREFGSLTPRYVDSSFCEVVIRNLIDVISEFDIASVPKFSSHCLQLVIPNNLSKLSPDRELWVVEKILFARNQYIKKPANPRLRIKTTGQLLSGFFASYKDNDFLACKDIFEQIKSRQNVSPHNMLHLELQVHKLNSNWQGIFDRVMRSQGNLLLLSHITTPIVIEAVIKLKLDSLYPNDFTPSEIRHLLKPYKKIFSGVSLNSMSDLDRDVWRGWALGAMAFGHSEVLQSLPVELLGENWIDDLRRWAEPRTSEVHVQSVSIERDETSNNIERKNQADLEDIRFLLSQENNGDNGLANQRKLKEFSDNALKDAREMPDLGPRLRALEGLDFSNYEVDNWLDWLRGQNKNSVDSLIPLHSVCEQWSKDSWDEASVKEFLEVVDDHDWMKLRDCLATMFNWLKDREIPASTDFILDIMIRMSSDGLGGEKDLFFFSELITKIFSHSHSKENYQDALEYVAVLWDEVSSLRCAEGSLVIMESLLDYICKDEDARLRLWLKFRSRYLKDWVKLDSVFQLSIREVELYLTGRSEDFPKEEDGEILTETVQLKGKKLAIYTLTEGAGRRAKKILGDLFPGLETIINHDKNNTDELSNLAETSDFFIFSSRSAAHQAFYPVQKIRGNNIIYPLGKGSSSIVRSFLDELRITY